MIGLAGIDRYKLWLEWIYRSSNSSSTRSSWLSLPALGSLFGGVIIFSGGVKNGRKSPYDAYLKREGKFGKFNIKSMCGQLRLVKMGGGKKLVILCLFFLQLK